MTPVVFCVVLLAAALHATWNAVVKGGVDKMMSTAMVAGSAAMMAVILLPFLPAPSSQSWPFIAASTLFQISYFALIARIYQISDMSQTYPLMRGTAPLLVAVSSAALLKEPLNVTAWLGLVCLCGGVAGMAATHLRGQGRGVSLALVNAAVIACYTLIDGAGVRRSGAPAAYTLWIFLLTGAPIVIWTFRAKGAVFHRYLASHWRLGAFGGFGAVVSYGLALWAMTLAPVAVVAALRETSILFATAISGFVLREKVGAARIAAAVVIAAGAAVLRLN